MIYCFIDIIFVMLKLIRIEHKKYKIGKIDVLCFSYNLILSGLILSLVCCMDVVVLVGLIYC